MGSHRDQTAAEIQARRKAQETQKILDKIRADHAKRLQQQRDRGKK